MPRLIRLNLYNQPAAAGGGGGSTAPTISTGPLYGPTNATASDVSEIARTTLTLPLLTIGSVLAIRAQAAIVAEVINWAAQQAQTTLNFALLEVQNALQARAQLGSYSVIALDNPFQVRAKLQGTAVEDYTTAGTYTWTCPGGVTAVKVECWGAGGGGGASTGAAGDGGGGGGAFAQLNAFASTPGTGYTIVVPPATSTGNGSSATFNSTSCVAAGGTAGSAPSGTTQGAGGPGGTVAASTGDVRFAGGDGGGGANLALNGGGGGGGAGTTGAGGAGNSNGTSGTGTSVGGGNGATGASGTTSATAAGNFGGGGGGKSTLGSSSGGAQGRVRLTYTVL